jgi:hypothetical protein
MFPRHSTGWRTLYGMRASDLEQLKMEPLLDSLRNEARFQAVERELKFPM